MENSLSKWEVDPTNSSVDFSVKHLMFAKVKGQFQRVHGTLQLDLDHPDHSTIEGEVESSSINTHEEKRDQYLKGEAFLDAQKFPAIQFKSKKVQKIAEDQFKILGDLVIHGMAHETELMTEIPLSRLKKQKETSRIRAFAKTKIRRKDFGLTWNAALEAGDILVGDEISINLDLQFFRSEDVL
jgi:polyisoprenoid-binding protein YceI